MNGKGGGQSHVDREGGVKNLDFVVDVIMDDPKVIIRKWYFTIRLTLIGRKVTELIQHLR